MASWLNKRREIGWTAVVTMPDGLYGVSVLAPKLPTDRPQVVSCGAVAGGQLNAEALMQLAKSIAVPGCAWTVVLDREAYRILVVDEPPVKTDEMAHSVRWAISSMVDFPVDDADLAWMKIPIQPSQTGRKPQLYVVATSHATLAACTLAFKQARIPLQAVDVHETAHRNLAALVERPGEGVALLSLGTEGVQFTVTFQGELYLDRWVKESMFGARIDDMARERASERVVLQVQRSLDFVGRTMPFIDLNRVKLAPMPSDYGLRKYFVENIPVPLEDFDLSSVFDLSKTPTLFRMENQAGYFVALGAALRFMDKTPA